MSDLPTDDGNIIQFPEPRGAGMEEAGGIGSEAVVSVDVDGGNQVHIFPSGAVAIVAPAVISHNYDDDEFGQNLAERLDDAVLANIANDLIDGVEADKQSRAQLVADYQEGLDLLGTKLESVTTASSSRSVSRVGHPLLMESIIKYQAGAEAEMLPAAGPVKVQTEGVVSAEEEFLANAFETDFNYFLTRIAREFYPDTSAMLTRLGYGGNEYKKIYRCPMRERPTSESISMLDMIVSESATDLDTAIRVTHQFEMNRAQLRRMQIAGRYRDIDLGVPQFPMDGVQQQIKQSQGLSSSQRPQDTPYTFWETDTDLDISEYSIQGKWENKAPWGMPLAYKVTVDQATRQVLGVWRNWRQDDRFYRKRNMYVHYGLVPSGFFHQWGFLQILGNQTRALRAIWRLMIDSGMFSNFPGGIIAKNARKGTNELSPAPGEWVDLDVPMGTDIRSVLMPLPYKALDAVFVQLAQIIQEGAARLGGAVMIETGEGRTNVPVGTMMAQIEQNTQVMAGVHKRTHIAQREELEKLRELFAENPQDLWRLARDPKRKWEVAEEFMGLNLSPASDPNIPSRIHRIQQAVALATIAQQNPQMYDMHEVNTRLLRTINIASPETLLVQPGVQTGPPPDPKIIAAQQRAQADAAKLQMKQQELALKAQDQQHDNQLAASKAGIDAQSEAQNRQVRAQEFALESADRAADRQARQQVNDVKLQIEQTQLEIERERLKSHQDERGRRALSEAFPPDDL